MRQVNLTDGSKRRQVRRTGPDGTVERQRVRSRVVPSVAADAHDVAELKSARATAKALGIEVEKKGLAKGYHLTTETFATSIIRGTFLASARGALGPFVYFANTPNDCEGKATTVQSLEDGALLTANVDLGYSLIASTRSPPPAVQSLLTIQSWDEITEAKLRVAGCQSVYATFFTSGHEWAVPAAAVDRATIRLSGYHKPAPQPGGTLVPVPFYQWPTWVNNLANVIDVDHDAIDAAAPTTTVRPTPPTDTKDGVRVNAAGRPVHSDGKFMSYKEARARGWGGSSGPLKKDGTPDMRYAANRAAKGSTATAVDISDHAPSGMQVLKKDGTPDMRYKANKAAAAVSSPHATSASGPLKKDGTPDMRYAANKAAAAVSSPRGNYSGSAHNSSNHSASGPVKKDGTPDMRYASNRGAVSRPSSTPSYSSSSYSSSSYSSSSYSSGGYSSGGGGGFSGSACYSVSSNPTGPTKADGTPDMRYSANRR